MTQDHEDDVEDSLTGPFPPERESWGTFTLTFYQCGITWSHPWLHLIEKEVDTCNNYKNYVPTPPHHKDLFSFMGACMVPRPLFVVRQVSSRCRCIQDGRSTRWQKSWTRTTCPESGKCIHLFTA